MVNIRCQKVKIKYLRGRIKIKFQHWWPVPPCNLGFQKLGDCNGPATVTGSVAKWIKECETFGDSRDKRFGNCYVTIEYRNANVSSLAVFNAALVRLLHNLSYSNI